MRLFFVMFTLCLLISCNSDNLSPHIFVPNKFTHPGNTADTKENEPTEETSPKPVKTIIKTTFATESEITEQLTDMQDTATTSHTDALISWKKIDEFPAVIEVSYRPKIAPTIEKLKHQAKGEFIRQRKFQCVAGSDEDIDTLKAITSYSNQGLLFIVGIVKEGYTPDHKHLEDKDTKNSSTRHSIESCPVCEMNKDTLYRVYTIDGPEYIIYEIQCVTENRARKKLTIPTKNREAFIEKILKLAHDEKLKQVLFSKDDKYILAIGPLRQVNALGQ